MYVYVVLSHQHKCNADLSQSHSEVPEADEDWPTLEDILGFRDRVRERLVRLYDDLESGKRIINRRVARMLVMTFEHEGFHVEVRSCLPSVLAFKLTPSNRHFFTCSFRGQDLVR